MQESRGEGSNSSGQPDGNSDQPKKQPAGRGIGETFGNPVVAAFITAASSLVIFTFNQVKQIDGRLDELEKEARLLLTPDGVAASKQALEAYYGVQSLKERFAYLEGKLHFHD